MLGNLPAEPAPCGSAEPAACLRQARPPFAGDARLLECVCRLTPTASSPMLGIHELWLFVLSGLLLNITPGPDTAYILGRSIQLGWRGGRAVGAADGVIDGVHGSEAGRRGLSRVHRHSDAAVALASDRRYQRAR